MITNCLKIFPLVCLLLVPACSSATPTLVFDEDALFESFPLGDWGQSGGLRFRITKVENVESLNIDMGRVRASGRNRLLVITLEVMHAQRGEAEVNLQSACSLVDGQGRGYELDEGKYVLLNGGDPQVVIPTGKYIIRKVVFETGKSFEPAALRCVVGEGAEPVYLRLIRAV